FGPSTTSGSTVRGSVENPARGPTYERTSVLAEEVQVHGGTSTTRGATSGAATSYGANTDVVGQPTLSTVEVDVAGAEVVGVVVVGLCFGSVVRDERGDVDGFEITTGFRCLLAPASTAPATAAATTTTKTPATAVTFIVLRRTVCRTSSDDASYALLVMLARC